MTVTAFVSHRPLAGLAALALLASLAGCDRQSVVISGRTRVSPEEAAAYLSRRATSGDSDVDAALGELAERALLAEAARKADVDDDPTVKARLAAARREILAAEYLDRELAQADREDLLRERYAARKDQLARRRIHVAHVAFLARDGEPRAKAAAQSKASRAYARLAGGDAFEAVAKEMSEDPVTGAKGGDLGPLLEGEVDQGFFEAAAALTAGEFSKPIETPYGFHVVKALERVETVTPSFDDVRSALAAEARRETQVKLLERLREDVSVRVYPDRVKRRSLEQGEKK
ncbi:peptidylprolyl isomerase [Anaeromyxobacter sp. Fw109-5]|uniref:peptidylprolyl isomerase n=1 Tax=Anaeromyxobacter sp. (strain Fw109-5) TaxID=404589 RepID=UPI0000ED7531|nr:peptidylprolyl isomerase [Anaeromyxobacter sp. Fw109-5]ABS26528.1 PpiC-type peptidyl-prolyl cis-trans isomerase [Anaeromyxobacter sp. Fw109-5]